MHSIMLLLAQRTPLFPLKQEANSVYESIRVPPNERVIIMIIISIVI